MTHRHRHAVSILAGGLHSHDASHPFASPPAIEHTVRRMLARAVRRSDASDWYAVCAARSSCDAYTRDVTFEARCAAEEAGTLLGAAYVVAGL